jgi:two-component system LytT family response regulator
MTETTTLRAILIDDEERARNTLSTLLAEYCPQVQVIATCASVPEGVLAINKLRPDLVFLDIEMPEYNGFELLGFFRDIDFEFIFVTAYNEHALRAFEVSASDYLLKPVEIGLLQAAVEKARQRRQLSGMRERLDVLREAFQGGDLKRIALTVNDGLLFVEVADLVMLEADGAYTKVFLRSGTSMIVSKKLRFFEEVLEHRLAFARPHRSFVVNLNFLKKYVRGESLLVMDNGQNVPIAREKKAEFEGLLRELKMMV